MKSSYLPLIIFGLFFAATLVGFVIFRKKEEEEEAKNDVNADQEETTVEQ